MAKLNNLNSNKVQERKRQVRTYGTKTDLASTTTERGNTHWTDGSNVNIDGFLGVAGTMTVSGVLSVTGTFNASGDINLSGSTSVTGPLDITGATTIGGSLDVTGPTTIDGVLTINGDTTITGTLDITGNTTITGDLDVDGPTTITGTLGIEGVTTLKNDLNVTTGGKIKAGNLEIEPANGGQINFLNGSLSSGSNGVLLNNTIGVELLGPTIDLTANKTNIAGSLEVTGRVIMRERLVLPGTPETGSSNFVPNVYMDSNGFLYKSTWNPA